ncbi:MAG: glycosyltransferase family 4 protein [Prevotella sp.]|jgi:hypothetical protein|nr:glycosyltransferase family 4 protein [Prevotella sp.]
MKILLVGEYSNVHWTLAEGLRALGHEVTVVSDGDGWKNYPRDINLKRGNLSSRLSTVNYLRKLACVLPRLRGFDIVQLINPVFLDLRAERIWPFYRYLRRHNGKVFLGAFGIDHYWVKVGMDCKTFRYSDFNFGSQLRDYPFMRTMVADWLHGSKGDLNRRIAEDCDGIITGLYEYDVCYRPFFPDKAHYIPFPINRSSVTHAHTLNLQPSTLNFFIGIQRSRSAYKGTDIMLSALQQLKSDYPDKLNIMTAEDVPFVQYQEMMNDSHALLDQLYSYTPGMNGLLAMAKGLILIGGGEREHYELLGEQELHPIINVQPTEEDVYQQIATRLLSGNEDIHQLQLDSIEYIRRHHDHLNVARKYEDFYLAH